MSAHNAPESKWLDRFNMPSTQGQRLADRATIQGLLFSEFSTYSNCVLPQVIVALHQDV